MDLKDIQGFSVDCDTGLVYCVSSKQIFGIDPSTNEVIVFAGITSTKNTQILQIVLIVINISLTN